MVERFVTANLWITLGFLALGIMVVAQAHAWPYRTALFPLVAGWTLLALVVLKLVVDAVGAARPATARDADVPSKGEDQGEPEDAFVTASRREWCGAFGWMTLFFGALWLLGASVGIPLFAVAYLLVVARASPLFACLYAFGCWLFVYGLFERGLNVPVPAGVLVRAIGL